MTDYAELRAALEAVKPGDGDTMLAYRLASGPTVIRALLADHDTYRQQAQHETDVAHAAFERVKALEAERDALIHDNAEYVSAANELATENQQLREALALAYGAMNYMGDILNGMDAVEEKDEVITGPAFEAVRAALAQEEA